MKSCFLLLHLIVISPETGGMSNTTTKIYVPENCEREMSKLMRLHNWVREKRDKRGRVQYTIAMSIAKVSQIPLPGGVK